MITAQIKHIYLTNGLIKKKKPDPESFVTT